MSVKGIVINTVVPVMMLFPFVNCTENEIITMPAEPSQVSYYNYEKESTFSFNNENKNEAILQIYKFNNEKSSKTKLEKDAELIFGNMRSMTTDEMELHSNYFRSISHPTNVNFWDLV